MTAQMLTLVITIASIYLGLVLISGWYDSKARREVAGALAAEKVMLRTSRILLLVLLLGGVLVSGVFASIIVMIPNKEIADFVIFGGIALFWFAFCSILVCLLYFSRVTVDAHTVEYVSGTKRLVIERHNIKDVYIQMGMIVIDTGDVRRHVIPMIFSESYRLVALLKRETERSETERS